MIESSVVVSWWWLFVASFTLVTGKAPNRQNTILPRLLRASQWLRLASVGQTHIFRVLGAGEILGELVGSSDGSSSPVIKAV
jgi:hypothetical protein